jgi:hypothetical protein
VFVRYGSPPTLVARAYDTLSQRSPEPTNLNQRFFTLSSRARVASWKTAWADFEDHTILGSGAGTYELYWAQNRPYATKVRDAHSIYLETLAELGPIGLGLLVAGFAVPAVAALRNRRAAFVPAAFAAYLAYLVHAGGDWDWEMTAVTMAALVSGAALLIAGRSEGDRELSRRVRFALVAVLLVVAAGTFVAAVGNQALASGKSAALAGRWGDAESHARTAMRWMPWSSDPWQLAGHAYLARGERERAEGALRTAIEKDPEDWELWLDLALATRGRERREVAAEAVRLNPLGPELASLRRLLNVETGQE